jgi:hypothetical protein
MASTRFGPPADAWAPEGLFPNLPLVTPVSQRGQPFQLQSCRPDAIDSISMPPHGTPESGFQPPVRVVEKDESRYACHCRSDILLGFVHPDNVFLLQLTVAFDAMTRFL